ncbi:odorant receptor 131-2-like [Trichomycterus rosablanca]|uniref:odorant receptor 131-2-like n=1 Tax=Trichomycterus rosablanca TaxID=2290929 RepID=UPI002F360EBB
MCTSDCNSSYHVQLVNPVQMSMSMGITQIFVWPFIYINIIMLFTFYRKQAFRTETRYILFAHTLILDLIFLILTDFVVLISYNYVLMPVALCIPLCMLMEAVATCTPLTITAMCVERYIAICMPLRHNAISTVSRTLIAIFVIWIISLIQPFVNLFILVATTSHNYLLALTFCHYEIMVLENWQRFLRGILYIITFSIIFLIEVICYVMIVLAARAASTDKKSAVKGLRTISLHMLQLFLCTIGIACPYIEAVVMNINIQVYLSVRFFNFILFSVIAKAVSPLVYGLRDEKFYSTMKYYIRCKQTQVSSESQEPNT